MVRASKLISKAEVVERIGVSFPTIWAWMRAGKFPRARELRGRPAWIENEVEKWIRARPLIKYKGLDDGVVLKPNSME
jgi:prophage regulatory protein